MFAEAVKTLARELAAASSPEEADRLLAERLRSLTGALAVGVSRFDPRTGQLHTRRLAAEAGVSEAARRLLGQPADTLNLHPGAFLEDILRQPPAVELGGMREVFFGQAPDAVASGLEQHLDIGRIYGLSFRSGRELLGTATVFMRRGAADLDLGALGAAAEAVSEALTARS